MNTFADPTTLEAMATDLAELRGRVADLEGRPAGDALSTTTILRINNRGFSEKELALGWSSVWDAASSYQGGSLVRWRKHLWVALAQIPESVLGLTHLAELQPGAVGAGITSSGVLEPEGAGAATQARIEGVLPVVPNPFVLPTSGGVNRALYAEGRGRFQMFQFAVHRNAKGEAVNVETEVFNSEGVRLFTPNEAGYNTVPGNIAWKYEAANGVPAIINEIPPQKAAEANAKLNLNSAAFGWGEGVGGEAETKLFIVQFIGGVHEESKAPFGAVKELPVTYSAVVKSPNLVEATGGNVEPQNAPTLWELVI